MIPIVAVFLLQHITNPLSLMIRPLIGSIVLVYLVFNGITISLAQEFEKIRLNSHFQDVRTFIALPDGADHNVLRLFRSRGQIIAS